MKKRELQQVVKLGEDSSRQFKIDVTNPDSLAAELVAFSNSHGGTILIGVADDGRLLGLSSDRRGVIWTNVAAQNAYRHAERGLIQ